MEAPKDDSKPLEPLKPRKKRKSSHVGKPRDKECLHCSTAFYDDSKQNSMKFCGPKCQGAFKRAKKGILALKDMRVTCAYCDVEFSPSVANAKYCTVLCRRLHKDADCPPELSRTVECLECGGHLMGRISVKHLEEHGLTVSGYLAKHEGSSVYSDLARWKISAVRDASWSDESRELLSASLTAYYAEHEVWNKGLTKEDHPGIDAAARKKSVRYRGEGNPFYGKKHKRSWLRASPCTKAYDSGQVSSWKISRLHARIVQALRDRGYKVELEHYFPMPEGHPSHPVDIYLPDLNLALEVDGCLYHKCDTHRSWEKVSSDWSTALKRKAERDALVMQTAPSWGIRLVRFWEHDFLSGTKGVGLSLEQAWSKLCASLGISSEGPPFPRDKETLSPNLEILLTHSSLRDSHKWTPQEATVYWRQRGFPYYGMTPSHFVRDFGHLQRLKALLTEDPPLKNLIGMKPLRYFYPQIWSCSSKGNLSPEALFSSDEHLFKLMVNRKKYAKDFSAGAIRTGLKLMTRAPGHFYPALALWLLRKYGHESHDPLIVLDPCAGFGGRLLGAMAHHKDTHYTGVDPWEANIDSARSLCEFYGFETRTSFHQAPAEKALLTLPKHSYDISLTSTPFFDLESYGAIEGDSTQSYPTYTSWLEGFVGGIAAGLDHALKPQGNALFHLGPDKKLQEDFVLIFKAKGFMLKESLTLEVSSVLAKKRRPDVVLVFTKGNMT